MKSIGEKKIKRNRPYSYSFRVSKEEREIIDKKVELSGKSKTDYLINALSNKEIVYVEKGNEILAELKRQGNNLNQAVKFNYFGCATEKELLDVLAECKKLYKQISEAVAGERNCHY